MARTKAEVVEFIEHLTVRCPQDVLDALRESAKEHDRSLNAEIVNALKERAKTYRAHKEKSHHELVGSRGN